MHILDFQILFWEKRNQRNKNGNVVRTLNWIRTVLVLKSSMQGIIHGFQQFLCGTILYPTHLPPPITLNLRGAHFETKNSGPTISCC